MKVPMAATFSAPHDRRAFLKRSAQLATTGAALPMVLQLAAMGEAAAMSANDYKALVGVFLYGGNDQTNTVVPYDLKSHNLYRAVRGGSGREEDGIAIARHRLDATVLRPVNAIFSGEEFALHPSMTGLSELFNQGAAGILLNVGPLVAPLTRAQYHHSNRLAYPLPPKLFSHNDQQSVWQSSNAEGSTRGWGGAMGDLALQTNGSSLLTCISAAGNAVFVSGSQANAYHISASGPVRITGAHGTGLYGSAAATQALDQIIRQTSTHPLEAEYAEVVRRSMMTESQVSAALRSSAASAAGMGRFPANNPLADQLQMVARLIAARDHLGLKRQVFLVSLPGFDLHDGLMLKHAPLLGRLSEAMTAFHKAMSNVGLGRQVTSFTASDFGRTLTSNGDGSDHGWGSHHFIVGAAVQGAMFYGKPPPISVGNTSEPEDQWHVGQGRLLPSTSVDQYAATLAKWFGVTDAEMGAVMPHLSNFGGSAYPKDLGFMTAT
jgi:uncharacterized protein (DUF1501 family)